MIERLGAAIKSMVTRGKVVNARMGARTLLQVTGLDGVVQQEIELLLPPGFSARPAVGADIMLFQVMGSGDHVVALGGDLAGNAIADLNPGEFGFSDGTNTVVFRSGAYSQGQCIEMTSATKIRCVTPRLECTGEIVDNCDGAFNRLGTHTHPAPGGNTSAPNPNT